GECGVLAVDEVQEELTVALGAGQARVYDADRRRRPRESRRGGLSQNPPVYLAVPDDASLADVGPARFELRLYEDDRFPPVLGERERRRQRRADADERDVAGDERGLKRKCVEVASVHPFEHCYARVVA